MNTTPPALWVGVNAAQDATRRKRINPLREASLAPYDAIDVHSLNAAWARVPGVYLSRPYLDPNENVLPPGYIVEDEHHVAAWMLVVEAGTNAVVPPQRVITQTLTAVEAGYAVSGKSFVRTITEPSTFNPWKEITSIGRGLATVAAQLPTGGYNLDDWRFSQPGAYLSTEYWTGTHANFPPGFRNTVAPFWVVPWLLVVEGGDNQFALSGEPRAVTQTLTGVGFAYDNSVRIEVPAVGASFTRTRLENGDWSEWIQLGASKRDGTFVPASGPLPGTYDLNAAPFDQPGAYLSAGWFNPSGSTNFPLGFHSPSHVPFLLVTEGIVPNGPESGIAQKLTAMENGTGPSGKVFTRTRGIDGIWTAWKVQGRDAIVAATNAGGGYSLSEWRFLMPGSYISQPNWNPAAHGDFPEGFLVEDYNIHPHPLYVVPWLLIVEGGENGHDEYVAKQTLVATGDGFDGNDYFPAPVKGRTFERVRLGSGSWTPWGTGATHIRKTIIDPDIDDKMAPRRVLLGESTGPPDYRTIWTAGDLDKLWEWTLLPGRDVSFPDLGPGFYAYYAPPGSPGGIPVQYGMGPGASCLKWAFLARGVPGPLLAVVNDGRLFDRVWDNSLNDGSGAYGEWREFAPTVHPRFDDTDTSANRQFSFTQLQLGGGLMGAGWTSVGGGPSPGGIYQHLPGNTANLAFEIEDGYVDYEPYVVGWVTAGGADTGAQGFGVYLATSATATSGWGVSGQYYSRDFRILNAGAGATHVIVVPEANFNGTIQIILYGSSAGRIARLTSQNTPTMTLKRNQPMFTQTHLLTMGLDTGGAWLGSGPPSIALGSYAMQNAFGMPFSIALGYMSLANVGTVEYSGTQSPGVNNTALGFYTLQGLRGGHNNTAVGWGALQHMSFTHGSANCGVGYNCLQGIEGNSSANVGLGENAGSSGRVFDGTYLGHFARGLDGAQNEVVIGSSTTGGGSDTITLGNNLHTAIRANVAAFSTLSDPRVKEDIEAANLSMCLDTVKRLPLKRWGWKAEAGSHRDKHVTGFMSDDLVKCFPKAVTRSTERFLTRGEDGHIATKTVSRRNPNTQAEWEPKTVTAEEPEMTTIANCARINLTELLPTLWGAVQQIIERLDALEKKVK